METKPDLENPVIKTDEGANFLKAAALHDRGEDIPADLLGEQPELETEENVPTAEELADPANKDRPRDPQTGKFIKQKTEATDDKPPIDGADASNTPSDSDYAAKQRERKEKESARLEKTWENVNREKEELAARREELRRYEESLRNPQQQRQQPQPREFSSEQLLAASEDFKVAAKAAFKRYQETGNDADLDEFNRNDQLAEQAFQNASEFFAVEQQEAQHAAIEQHNRTWVKNMEAEIKAMPDLAKPDAPIAKEMLDLLKTHGAVFQMLPDGFKQAVAIAQLRLDAKDAPTLREQLKKEKEEVARLTALTQPSAGGVTGPVTEKAFSDKSSEDQFASIMAGAARIDAGE